MYRSELITRFARLARPFLVVALFALFAQGPSRAQATPSDGNADRVLGQAGFSSLANGSGYNQLYWPAAVTVDRSGGRIYVADRRNNRVLGWPSATSFTNGQPASYLIQVGADLTATGVATDSRGRVYVANYGHQTVLRFPAPTSLSSPASDQTIGQNDVIGTSAINLSGPWAIAFDKSDNLYVADSTNSRILMFPFDGSAGAVSPTATIVLGQPGFSGWAANNGGISASTLSQPRGVAVDNFGNAYVSDTDNNRVLKYSPPLATGMSAVQVIGQANFTSSLPDCGASTSARCLNWPAGVAINTWGNPFVADVNNNRVLGFLSSSANGPNASAIFGQAAYTTKYAGAAANMLNQPYGVALDNTGNVYIADYFNNRVLGFDGPYLQSMYLPFVRR